MKDSGGMKLALDRKLLHGGAAFIVICLLAGAAWWGYSEVVTHPVTRVVFAGPTERLDAAQLDALARGIRSGEARVSLAAAREAARRIPWVREASVRRVSAGTLEIRFDVHEPLARWNDTALVSARGEIFSADFEGPLPRFRGADTAAGAMAREYPRLAQAVVPLASPIVELRLSPRGAWQASLESGLVLDLGRIDMESRIARFAAAWPDLAARGIATNHADLRYPNGFALRKLEKEKKKTT